MRKKVNDAVTQGRGEEPHRPSTYKELHAQFAEKQQEIEQTLESNHRHLE